MHTPGTDAYEVRKKVAEIMGEIGVLGQSLLTPSDGDESIHLEVRGVMAGYTAAAGLVLQGLYEVTGCITDVGILSE